MSGARGKGCGKADQPAPTKQVLDLGETEVEEELFNDFLQCVHAGPSALACVDTYLTDPPPL
jgi:hypothetical protein